MDFLKHADHERGAYQSRGQEFATMGGNVHNSAP
jgi:hypothetical protein